ncbi:hypothetical protein B0H16DRAFT_1703125 [Mycena metata]|uniref:Uncharacterized protein n=1 Tax=Mycena metata TaxID=1033252 RepID=A0AAD7MDF2_9AGAR|nr:hypothetical protein B0H16DRAFT_1703125 [Mycena metata]
MHSEMDRSRKPSYRCLRRENPRPKAAHGNQSRKPSVVEVTVVCRRKPNPKVSPTLEDIMWDWSGERRIRGLDAVRKVRYQTETQGSTNDLVSEGKRVSLRLALEIEPGEGAVRRVLNAQVSRIRSGEDVGTWRHRRIEMSGIYVELVNISGFALGQNGSSKNQSSCVYLKETHDLDEHERKGFPRSPLNHSPTYTTHKLTKWVAGYQRYNSIRLLARYTWDETRKCSAMWCDANAMRCKYEYELPAPAILTESKSQPAPAPNPKTSPPPPRYPTTRTSRAAPQPLARHPPRRHPYEYPSPSSSSSWCGRGPARLRSDAEAAGVGLGEEGFGGIWALDNGYMSLGPSRTPEKHRAARECGGRRNDTKEGGMTRRKKGKQMNDAKKGTGRDGRDKRGKRKGRDKRREKKHRWGMRERKGEGRKGRRESSEERNNT